MLIGELARRAGTSTRMVRYYEQHGLVRPGRSTNGYRVYDEQELDIVRKIRGLLELGFDLDDARPFVSCLRDGHGSTDTCPESVESLRDKLTELDDTIERLTAIRRHVRARLDAAAPKCEFSQ